MWLSLLDLLKKGAGGGGERPRVWSVQGPRTE